MKRQTFLKITTAGVGALLVPGSVFRSIYQKFPNVGLENSFKNPADVGKAFTWWHWMNGNVTKDGITRDLEFMKKVGIGGFQLFQAGIDIPKGPVKFGKSKWVQLLKHAAKEANRLGLEYDMMNGGGWSSSGGPWITPELSMKQFTWSETFIEGGYTVSVQLPKPYTKRNYYEDACVLAFPSLKGEIRPMRSKLEKAATNRTRVDIEHLTNGDLSKGVKIEAKDSSEAPYLELTLKNPLSVRSIAVYTVSTNPGYYFNVPPMWLEVSSDGSDYEKVCDLNIPKGQYSRIEVPSTANFKGPKARYFRIVSKKSVQIAHIKLSGAVYEKKWPCKANFVHRFGYGTEKPFTSIVDVPENSIIDSDSIVDITQYMDEEGHLNWQAPVGNWTILRMGQTTTGAKNHPAPDGGIGLECDKYSKEAYDFHFNHFFGKLLPLLKTLGNKKMAGSVIDSYEVGMQTWTSKFPQKFKQRRGYDVKKYLPAMTGRIVDSAEISDRFLWDIRRTDADLIADNYYGRFTELCGKHNMKSYAEPYSDGPFEEMQAGSELDVPMGEFWADRGRLGRTAAFSVKLASSIGHIYGKKVIAAESYTGAPNIAKWQQYPYGMKAQGDWMYTHGLNKFIFHVYAMQPHPTAKPGMTMGPYGWMHSRNNTWAQGENDWLSYVQRTQYLLQQGRPVIDIVYYNGVKVPVNTAVWPDQLHPSPPKGFYYDVADTKAIMNRMKVNEGKIELPSGIKYKVLVLPQSKKISLGVLGKIKKMVRQGVCLVGPKPERVPGLYNYKGKQVRLQKITDEIWGDLDGDKNTHRVYDKGHVFWGAPMANIMNILNMQPDFEFTSQSGDAPINYIHRKVKGDDIYFIANRRRQSEDLVCTFRVKGKQPEFWDPKTEEMVSAGIYENTGSRTRVPIHLNPAGSLFVVFRSAEKGSLHTIAKDGKTIMGTTPYPKPKVGRHRGLSSNFSISLWVKPDVDINLSNPESFAIYPPAGTQLYGAGHAACGLVVGRNGVAVYERSDNLNKVLSVTRPLAGWTHLVIIYKAGMPFLYINGKLAGKTQKTGKTVHPGLHEAYQDDGAYYFAGEMSKPKLFSKVINKSRIRKLKNRGIPVPEGPPILEPAGESNPALRIWQNGTYSLRDNKGQTTSIQVSHNDAPKQIKGPWKVSFPPNLGAPDQITLDKLISLKDHPHDGVKYFSGTATYSKIINIPSHFMSGNKHLFLDLGWVEVMANVQLNGKNVGAVWKKPYRIEISNFIHDGKNKLEIEVTNLWPNRLIGDEHLPAENQYEKNGAIKKLPDWYKKEKPKPPGGRITFATWKHYDKNDPLLESGLLGPVKLRTAVCKELTI